MTEIDGLSTFKNVPILETLPPGWKYIQGATNAPKGYKWCSNGESRFSGKYKHALVKEKR